MYIRRCCLCGLPICECMGYVVARDVLAGKSCPREICAKCGVVALDDPSEQFEQLRKQDNCAQASQ